MRRVDSGGAARRRAAASRAAGVVVDDVRAGRAAAIRRWRNDGQSRQAATGGLTTHVACARGQGSGAATGNDGGWPATVRRRP